MLANGDVCLGFVVKFPQEDTHPPPYSTKDKLKRRVFMLFEKGPLFSPHAILHLLHRQHRRRRDHGVKSISEERLGQLIARLSV